MPHIRGVILDVDGTLIDSNDAQAHAWVEAMAANGFHVAFDKVRPLIGMGGDKVHVGTIAFRCGGWKDTDLKGAIAIYDGPADLLEHYDSSPLAQ